MLFPDRDGVIIARRFHLSVIRIGHSMGFVTYQPSANPAVQPCDPSIASNLSGTVYVMNGVTGLAAAVNCNARLLQQFRVERNE
jgi:hypothetical protein